MRAAKWQGRPVLDEASWRRSRYNFWSAGWLFDWRVASPSSCGQPIRVADAECVEPHAEVPTRWRWSLILGTHGIPHLAPCRLACQAQESQKAKVRRRRSSKRSSLLILVLELATLCWALGRRPFKCVSYGILEDLIVPTISRFPCRTPTCSILTLFAEFATSRTLWTYLAKFGLSPAARYRVSPGEIQFICPGWSRSKHRSRNRRCAMTDTNTFNLRFGFPLWLTRSTLEAVR